MNYSTVANDVLFKPIPGPNWEHNPYVTGHDGAGDLHFYERTANLVQANFNSKSLNGKIPDTYIKLNIRNKLKALYPGNFPNLDTVGYEVFKTLKDTGIHRFITAEDRGWESSDFWATIEAIYISSEDFNTHLLPRIDQAAQSILNPGSKRITRKRSSPKISPLPKKTKNCNPKLAQEQKIQFFTIHDEIERACAICEDIKEDHLGGFFIKMSHGEKGHHERIESLAQNVFASICKADSEGKKKTTIDISKVKDQHIALVQWVFKQKLDLAIKIEERHRMEDCIFLVDRISVSWN